MDIKITGPDKIDASLSAISSKSYVHRLLIAAALSDKESFIKTNIISKDMTATVNCLNALGGELKIVDGGIKVAHGLSFSDEAHLDCIESGSTARFMLPVAAHFSSSVLMTGEGKLPERPFGPLCEALRKNGVRVDSDLIPIKTEGRVKAGVFELPGNVSSQFITGLLFTLPLLESDSRIVLTSHLESAAYVDITIEVLKLFNIRIDVEENGYLVKGNQKYEGPTEIIAEGDWSNAAYVLGMGAIKGKITLDNVNNESVQGDRAVINVLKSFGSTIVLTKAQGKENISVEKNGLKPVTIDGSEIPDLIPALAVIASFAEGESKFLNIERLRIKESDRIKAIEDILKAIGRESEVITREGHEDLVVKGVPAGEIEFSSPITIDGYNDHRIVMAAAMASLGVDVPVLIKGACAVSKSYPTFFEECRKMGFEVTCTSNES